MPVQEPQQRTGEVLDYARPNDPEPSLGKNEAKWVLPLAFGILGIIAFLLLFSAILPSLGGHSRKREDRVKCSSNLRQIGLGMVLYAHENKGQYPTNFELLISNADLNPPVFICPSSNDQPASGSDIKQMVLDFRNPGRCSYVYLAKGMKEPIAPNVVLAYENLANHGQEGMHVLYGDGRVDWLKKAEADKLIAEVTKGFNPPRRTVTSK